MAQTTFHYYNLANTILITANYTIPVNGEVRSSTNIPELDLYVSSGQLDRSVTLDSKHLEPTDFSYLGGTALQSTTILALLSAAIPFLLVSSGSVGRDGALSGLTALNTIYGWSYCYFPSGAVYATSPAGWYLTNLTSTTAGTIYANRYTTGQPQLPATNTPIVSQATGAYTQTTGIDIIGPTANLGGGSLGRHGVLPWERVVCNNSSAGAKTTSIYVDSVAIESNTNTTSQFWGGGGVMRNRGLESKNVSLSSQSGEKGVGSTIIYSTVDTTVTQPVSQTLKLAVATDYLVLESYFLGMIPRF